MKGPGLRGSIKAQRAGRTTEQQSSTHSYSRSLSSLLPLCTLSCTTHFEHHVLPRRRPLYPCLRRPCGRRQQLQHRPRSVLQQAREGTSQTSSLIPCAGLPSLTWADFTGGLCCRRGDPVRARRGRPGRDGEDRAGVLAHLRRRGRERQHLLFPARVLREQQCCEYFAVLWRAVHGRLTIGVAQGGLVSIGCAPVML